MKASMRDGSGHRHYRYTFEDIDRHGNTRIYFRRKGPKIRLRSTPGTDEFDIEYKAAFQAATITTVKSGPATPGTMQWLCEQYYTSAAFRQLDEHATRRVRRRILESVCRRAGSFRYAQMRPSDVAKLRDEKAETPEAANSIVKALRQLFAWAMLPEYRHAATNPAREVGYLKPHRPDGHEPWTEDDVAKFEKRHPVGTKARLTLDLMLCTGVRIGDAIRLGPQMERDGKLYFTESKGKARKIKPHAMPILPALRASIDASSTGHLVYLVTEYGRPYASPKAFGNWFSRQIGMAGVTGKSAHGLRKLAAIRWAERGATEAQLQAWFGWTTAKQSSVYTRKVNRERLEAETAALILNESAPLSRPVESSGAIRPKKETKSKAV